MPGEPLQGNSFERREQTCLLASGVLELRIGILCRSVLHGNSSHDCLARFFTTAYASSGESRTMINQMGIVISARVTRLMKRLWFSLASPESAPVTTAC